MNELIQALQNPERFDHTVDEFAILQTHISWVLLTGRWAYKIKKPLRLGFVDFSSPALRRRYCHEELRLNRRTAPGLYTGVAAICGSEAEPILVPDADQNPPDGAFEYAVKMRQFPQHTIAREIIRRNELTTDHVDALAARVGAFHSSATAAASNTVHGDADEVQHWAMENFDYFAPLTQNPDRRTRIESLKRWTESEFERCREQLQQRKSAGFIRECHGDLHLGNIVVLDGEPVPFDCIEFNEALRWIDVINDTAFLVMDLFDHDHPHLGRHLLNRYLHRTGDYTAVTLLRYYLVYRSLVRAKVAALRLTQDETAGGRADTIDECDKYLALAGAFSRQGQPSLVITHGYSGSGKSYIARKLSHTIDAIHVRSDIERKRLFGFGEHENTGSAVGSGIYTEQADRDTYDRLLHDAAGIIQGGYTALIDATFIKREPRRRFRHLAEQLNVPCVILSCNAPVDELKRRIAQRERTGADPSEAGLAVLDSQLEASDPLDDSERRSTVAVDTVRPPTLQALIEQLREQTGPLSM